MNHVFFFSNASYFGKCICSEKNKEKHVVVNKPFTEKKTSDEKRNVNYAAKSKKINK